MNTMQGDKQQELREELIKLRQEHRELDMQILEMESPGGAADQLQIRRLKKQKLALKDRITALEDRLTPDIIA